MQQVYFETTSEVLVHKRWHQNLCTIMQSQKTSKNISIPRCYSTILQQIQSRCTKKTLLSPNSSCHTKSCRNVAHVHRINGSLYFRTPFATISMQYSQESSRHATQCKNMYPSHLKTIVRIRTRSHLFPAVADVSKYLYTLIIPVSSLLSVSAY